jgi:hypothetical protein
MFNADGIRCQGVISSELRFSELSTRHSKVQCLRFHGSDRAQNRCPIIAALVRLQDQRE